MEGGRRRGLGQTFGGRVHHSRRAVRERPLDRRRRKCAVHDDRWLAAKAGVGCDVVDLAHGVARGLQPHDVPTSEYGCGFLRRGQLDDLQLGPQLGQDVDHLVGAMVPSRYGQAGSARGQRH